MEDEQPAATIEEPATTPPPQEDAPVAIDYRFTLPEGIASDDKGLSEFSDLAKQAGLNPESAQKIIDLHYRTAQAVTDNIYGQWQNQQNTWQQATKTDPELGGSNFETVLATIAKAIDDFGGKNLREALNVTGAGNHPEVIRAFYRMGKELGSREESATLSGKPPALPKSAASILYPSHAQER